MLSVPEVLRVTSLVYQSFVPGVPAVTARFADGTVLSILSVTESLEDPPALCAEHDEVTAVVSDVKFCVPHPESITTEDSGSVTAQATDTLLVYQPCKPSVPVITFVITGGVASDGLTVIVVTTGPLPL
jgi:hypothetical protein